MSCLNQQSATSTSDDLTQLEEFGSATGLFELDTVTPNALTPEGLELNVTNQATTHTVGSFFLDVSASSIRVRHHRDRFRTIWQSDPNRLFLAVARGAADFKKLGSAGGAFQETDHGGSLMNLDSLDSVSIADARGLTVFGTVSNAREKRICSLGFWALSENHLQFTIEIQGPDASEWNQISLRCASAEDEAFFGFGKQLNKVNQKGKLIPILVQEPGVARGLPVLQKIVHLFRDGASDVSSVTDAPVPHYITSQMRSVFLENKECSVFDLRAEDSLEITVFASKMAGRILFGRSPLDLVEEYTAYSGRTRRMPDWVHEGVMVEVHGGTAKASVLFDKLTSAKVPVSALWVTDWTGPSPVDDERQVLLNWQLDRRHYPGWDEFVEKLAQNGARVCLCISPLLASDLGTPDDPRPSELYREAYERGYLVKRAGAPFTFMNSSVHAGMIDLSNPDARGWMKELINREVIDIAQASGWAADSGKALPLDAELFNGADPRNWRNRYPEEWGRLNREAIQDSIEYRDLMFWNRSGFTQSPGLSMSFCLGDQMQSWDEKDGIKAAVVGFLSSGVSGFSLSHSDTGGFIAAKLAGVPLIARSRELLMRWIDLSAFTAVFRTQEGLIPSISAQVDCDDEALSHLATFARVYKCLAPYRRYLAEQAASKGYPIARPMFLHFPDDSLVYDLGHQFMLGPDFLIAPVLDKGAESVRVYLPAGKWTHLWTGREYLSAVGEFTDIPAPLGQPCVLYRTGAATGEFLVRELMADGVI